MTFEQIKAEVLSNLGNNPKITPTELSAAVSRAYSRVALALGGINTDYELNINTQLERIQLPGQLVSLTEVRYLPTDTENGYLLKQAYRRWQGDKAYGEPAQFFIDNIKTRDRSVIYFNPIPAAGIIRIDCNIVPGGSVTDAATLRLKDGEQDLVVGSATCILALRHQPELYSAYKNEYEHLLSQTKEIRKSMNDLAQLPTLDELGGDSHFDHPQARWSVSE